MRWPAYWINFEDSSGTGAFYNMVRNIIWCILQSFMNAFVQVQSSKLYLDLHIPGYPLGCKCIVLASRHLYHWGLVAIRIHAYRYWPGKFSTKKLYSWLLVTLMSCGPPELHIRARLLTASPITMGYFVTSKMPCLCWQNLFVLHETSFSGP